MATQAKPSSPVTTNDIRQPKLPISQATSGSDRAAPMREPLSKMLAAMARSLRGNQAMLILVPDGYAPASPTPSSNRYPVSVATPCAVAVRMVAMDHHVTAMARAIFAPTLSANQPNGN